MLRNQCAFRVSNTTFYKKYNMYPNALTPEQFKQEQPTREQQLEDAEYFLAKRASPHQVARNLGIINDDKTRLFIENLALLLDEFEGMDSEQRWQHLEELWPEVTIHTELEYIRNSKRVTSSDLPW